MLANATHSDIKSYMNEYQEQLASAPLSEFVEQVGHFFDRFGFRRNLGRIWATLYLAPEPLSQPEICELLGLSTGLVSSSLKELERWRAVKVVSIRGQRGSRYEAEQKLLRIVASILAQRELEAVRRLREASAAVRKTYPPAIEDERMQKRLWAVEHVADLYEVLAGLIRTMASLPLNVVDQTVRAAKLARIMERAALRRSK